MLKRVDRVGLRYLLAPAGSWREHMARLLLGPMLRRLRTRGATAVRKAQVAGSPKPYVTTEEGPAQRMRTLPPNPRILLLKLDHIGDFVLSLAGFETIRLAFPDAHITLVCAPWATAWAGATGFFERVVPFAFFTQQREDWRGAGNTVFSAYDALNLGTFDLAVDLRHDPDTRPLLARTAATFRAGYYASPAEGGEKLDIALPFAEQAFPGAGACRPLHAGLRVTALAATVAASFARRNEALVHRLRKGGLPEGVIRPYAVIAPGAGAKIREWPHDRLIAVARMLQQDHGLQIVISGSAREAEAGRLIAAALAPGAVLDLTGQVDLSALPELLAQARLFIGNDTGTTHLAAALGTPSVAIMSGMPTQEVWPPVGAAVRVVAGRARCAPCHIQRPEACPFDIACLNAVKIDDVKIACLDLLAETRSPRIAR